MAMGGVVVKVAGGGALVVGMSVPKKWVRVTYKPQTKTAKNTTSLSFLSSSSVSYSILTNPNKNKKNRDGICWRSALRLSLSPLFPSRLHKCRSLSSSSEDRPDFSSLSDSGGMGSESHHPSHRKFLTLPTVLTLGRVAAVPLLIATFYVESWWGTSATTSIFIAAAITDWLDGYLARKMKLGSAFGAFLDPVADKLMVAATLVLLCTKPMDSGVLGEVPWLLTVPAIAIIGREITMSAVREWAASQNTKLLEAVAVNNLGKWKTATQMTALTILVATRDSSLGGPGFLVASGVMLLYLSAGLAVWSLVVYMRKIWRVLMK